MDKLADLLEPVWNRFLNPRNVYLQTGLFFVLLAALWSHSWLFIIAAWICLWSSPWWFPAPEEPDEFWGRVGRGVLGWIRQAPAQYFAAMMAYGLVIFCLLVWAAWTRHFGLTVILALVFLGLKSLFIFQVTPPKEK